MGLAVTSGATGWTKVLNQQVRLAGQKEDFDVLLAVSRNGSKGVNETGTHGLHP